MKRSPVLFLIVALTFSVSHSADAARRTRVVVRTPHTRVVVHTGFPIHRTLPTVVVRTGPVVRVAPRVYLPSVAFVATVAALPPATARVWSHDESIDREDGWTEFTTNIDKRGNRLFLQIDRGAAQFSFAEVVFENGETQVVDFSDAVHAPGVYSLLDFKDGRAVDHVRVVAKAATESTTISLHLVS